MTRGAYITAIVSIAFILAIGLFTGWGLFHARSAATVQTADTNTGGSFGGGGAKTYTTTVGSEQNVQAGEGAIWSLQGVDGYPVEVSPFIASSTQKPEGIFLLDGDWMPNQDFTINYVSYSDSFTVTLLKEPLSQTRSAAEQELLSRLNIQEQDACRLKYYIFVPPTVNPVYADKDNIRFSFCTGPNDTVLP